MAVAFGPSDQGLEACSFENVLFRQIRQSQVQRLMEISLKLLPAFQPVIDFDVAVQPPVHGNMGQARGLVAPQLSKGYLWHFTQIYKEHGLTLAAF